MFGKCGHTVIDSWINGWVEYSESGNHGQFKDSWIMNERLYIDVLVKSICTIGQLEDSWMKGCEEQCMVNVVNGQYLTVE